LKKQHLKYMIMLTFVVFLYTARVSIIFNSLNPKAKPSTHKELSLSSLEVDSYTVLTQRIRKIIQFGNNLVPHSKMISLLPKKSLLEVFSIFNRRIVFPDIRDKIVRQITLHFHGSKYKDIIFLS
jgi:hypothetical protein